MAIGAELEMIPVFAKNGKRILARGTDPSGEQFLSAMANEFGWTEEPMSPDPSSWNFQDGRATFEPGGQIEFSSAVFPTAGLLIESLEKWLARFADFARRMGIELRQIGADDRSSIEVIPLQLHRERYALMTRYFESLGSYGVLMMRQTASLQINVDRGEAPLDRWRLLNGLTPYLVAIFANSARYADSDTGHRSYRAHIWRSLDPSRTGVPYQSGREAEHYLEFALNAPVILACNGREFPTFRQLVDDGVATRQDWEVHLSTLFPEIRPRDYFEIRSIDSIAARHVCAAIALVAGIVYSERSSAAALTLLGDPDSGMLVTAGQRGLRDSQLRDGATKLVTLALEGCRTLGTEYISERQLSEAAEYFDTYTLRGRSPADDVRSD